MLNNQIKASGADALKQSLIEWISTLQGTGDQQLNEIVNELNRLRHTFGESQPDTTQLNTAMSRLHRKVKNVIATQGTTSHNSLQEIDKHLKQLNTQ